MASRRTPDRSYRAPGDALKVRKSDLQRRAADCVHAMGDIFWDAGLWTQRGVEYANPEAIAINEVTDEMIHLVRSLRVPVELDAHDLVVQVLRP